MILWFGLKGRTEHKSFRARKVSVPTGQNENLRYWLVYCYCKEPPVETKATNSHRLEDLQPDQIVEIISGQRSPQPLAVKISNLEITILTYKLMADK